jgi:predicted ATPase
MAHPRPTGQFPLVRARGEPRTNLPSALSTFIGRTAETAAVVEAVRRTRLVTLAGPGGAGKTRLALEAAGRVSEAFPDGTWLADLTPLRGPELVATQVATAVSLDVAALATSGRPLLDALCEQLRHRRLLLVLDNCEHVVAAAADLAHALLATSPDVVVLATSREVLGVPGETVLRIGGLGLPAHGEVTLTQVAESEAGELFCARATESTAGFALTETNAEAVARICGRLDGIPLALELAAARIGLLGAHQLAARLDGLQLLSGGPRTAAARHRTLEAAIEWSYDLLPETERAVLRRLSVFPAPWTLAAATAVAAKGPDALDGPPAAAVLDLVGRLIDKSLVLPVSHDGADEPRYRLLETIRQFAAGRLAAAAETDTIRNRHRDFLIACTTGWTDVLYDAGWLRWVDREIDGFRAALAWSADRADDAAILKLVAPLWTYWEYSGTPAETLPWLERAVAAPPEIDAVSAVHARIGLVRQLGSVGGGENLRREPLLREAQELAVATGEIEAEAWAILYLVDHWAREGRWAESERLGERLVERLGERLMTAGWPGVVWIDWGRSMFALSRGDVADAGRLLREAVARESHRPDGYSSLSLLALLGLAEAAAGDAEAARLAAEAAVRAARGVPGPGILVMALVRAVEAALLSDEPSWTRDLLEELLVVLRDVGGRRWVAESLDVTAILLVAADPSAAATCLGAAQALRTELHEGGTIVPALSERVAAADAEISGVLGQEADADARRRGAALPVAKILSLAHQALSDLPGP